MTELDKAKERIRNLAAKTVDRGCSEAEAVSAMEVVGRLLDRFNLSMDDVMITSEPLVFGYHLTGQKRRNPLVDYAAVAIARFCDCMVTFNKSRTNSRYAYFGMEPDVEMAIYLTKIVTEAGKTALENFKSSDPIYINPAYHRKTVSTSFAKGFSNRICSRLNELKSSRTREATESNGRDIVPVKMAKIEEEYRKRIGKTKKAYGSRSQQDYSAHRAGSGAADRVNLSRPINSGGREQLLLGDR